jgi:hypothetical protein
MPSARAFYNLQYTFCNIQFVNYPAIAEDILRWCDIHTYYVQQLCNRVFAATFKQVTPELWKEQAFELLKEQEIIFLGYFQHKSLIKENLTFL